MPDEVKQREGTLVLPALIFIVVFAAFIINFRDPPHHRRTKIIMPRDEPVTDSELIALCEKLWDLDENRLVPDEDYELDLQGRTRFSYDGPDKADDPLFKSVNQNVFKRDTYKAFVALLDNYESATGVPEVVTQQEKEENWRFINLVFKSEVMQEAYRFLKSKRKASADVDEFKREFYNIWFNLYRRTRGARTQDSSGFEHVFVGETRGEKEVIGFHNWIQFYLQEKKGNVDYKGFMSGAKNPHLLTIQFSWKGEVKPKGSSLIGVSPEFEITLYTVVFLMEYDSVNLVLGGDDVVIKCHQTARKIGTCYPVMPYRKR